MDSSRPSSHNERFQHYAHLQALGLMDFLGDLKDSGSPPDHDAIIAFSGFKQALHDLVQDPPQDADAIFASAQPTRPPIKKARPSGKRRLKRGPGS